jgi:hypothetical protein
MMSLDDNEVASACERKGKSAMKSQERPCNGLALLSKKQHDTDDNEVPSACERKCKSGMMPQQVGDDAATSRQLCRKNRDKSWSFTASSNKAAKSHRSGKVAVRHKLA